MSKPYDDEHQEEQKSATKAPSVSRRFWWLILLSLILFFGSIFMFGNLIFFLDAYDDVVFELGEQVSADDPPAGEVIEPRTVCPGKAAGEQLILNIKGVAFPFRWCPAGTFTMGSPESEPARDPDEVQHEVVLTRGFWLLETEVTQEMYETITGRNPSFFAHRASSDQDSVRQRRMPVENVTWEGAQNFCLSLSQALPMANACFTLPTEAQWEYACRAGTTTAFWNGNEIATEVTNYSREASTGDGTPAEISTGPNEVGKGVANPWSLYDMHGNVWEWCQDRYNEDFYNQSGKEDPAGPDKGFLRVNRGGSWRSHPRCCRSAYRRANSPSDYNEYLGFRIAMVLEPR